MSVRSIAKLNTPSNVETDSREHVFFWYGRDVTVWVRQKEADQRADLICREDHQVLSEKWGGRSCHLGNIASGKQTVCY